LERCKNCTLSPVNRSPKQEQESEGGDVDITGGITGGEGGQVGSGNDQGGNTGSDEDYEFQEN
jgi:hypothetical protein